MDLFKIRGNTYYIDAPTNVGVFSYRNKNCLVIDTGINNTQGRKIMEVTESSGLHPKFIFNTHNHPDHSAGNRVFREAYPGVIVHASPLAKIYIENPIVHSTMLFSASAPSTIFRSSPVHNIDVELAAGQCKIGDEKFTVFELPGHSPDQIGIMTSDKVLFCGDAVFSRETIEKYKIPYLHDAAAYLSSMEMLKQTDAEIFVIGHSSPPLEKDDFTTLVDFNIANLQDCCALIVDLCAQPQTKESLLENLISLYELEVDELQYLLDFASVSALVSMLLDAGKLKVEIQSGRMYFYA